MSPFLSHCFLAKQTATRISWAITDMQVRDHSLGDPLQGPLCSRRETNHGWGMKDTTCVAVASGPIAGREARTQAAETLRDSAIWPHGCPGHVQASSSGQDAPHSHSQSPEERVESEQAGIIQKGRRACASGSRGCELPTQVDTGCPRPPDASGGRDTQARPAGGLGSGIWDSVKTMG